MTFRLEASDWSSRGDHRVCECVHCVALLYTTARTCAAEEEQRGERFWCVGVLVNCLFTVN